MSDRRIPAVAALFFLGVSSCASAEPAAPRGAAGGPPAVAQARTASPEPRPMASDVRATTLSDVLKAALPGFIGLAGTWLALWVGRRNADASTNQKANEAELASIVARLDGFYGPYLQRSEENRLLAEELRSRQPAGFRTLIGLLDPAWNPSLDKADGTIVDEVVENGRELRAMLRDKAASVEPALRPFLAEAATHFTMLILARAGSLSNDPARFRRYVYPRRLDEVLSADLERLRTRAALLAASPAALHPRLAALAIPPDAGA